MPSGPHDEFLELCAASTSGQLSEAEQIRLQEHLTVCPECREALREYQSVVDDTMPAIGAEQLSDESSRIDPGPSWSQSRAEKAFFKRLAQEESQKSDGAERKDGMTVAFRRVLPIAPESTWRHVWMLYAAGILLFITLRLSAYWVGVLHGSGVAKATPPITTTQDKLALAITSSPEEQLSNAAHEREIARAQIEQRDKALADLRHRLELQATEISRMTQAQGQLESRLRSEETDKQDLIQQRAEAGQKSESAQAESLALQRQVASLTQQSANETAQAKALGATVDDLTHLLQDREASLGRDEELLSHDRDIRELIGARDLYIAEVYDVGDNGATRKPYGRVFYTKGKSLIFYAYDLEQQETKRAKVFQAWGRRELDRQVALDLGIFYEDSGSGKRWVMKCADPQRLAQIDAVFVTVEPSGGSHKPSSGPLLFAYLKVNPNHP